MNIKKGKAADLAERAANMLASDAPINEMQIEHAMVNGQGPQDRNSCDNCPTKPNEGHWAAKHKRSSFKS